MHEPAQLSTGELYAPAGTAPPANLTEPIAHPVVSEAAPAALREPLPALLEGRGWTLSCLVLDGAMLALALAAALVGADAADVTTGPGLAVWLFPVLVVATLALRAMYKPRIQLRALDDITRVVSTTSVSAMSIIAIGAFTAPSVGQPSLMARVWLFSMLYVAGGRLLLTLTLRRARAVRVARTPTLIVGAGRVGAQVERRLRDSPELGLDPVGFVDAMPAPDEKVPGRRGQVLGGPDDLARVVEQTGARHVILAFLSSRGADARMVQIVRQCEDLGLDVSLVPRLFESISVGAELEHIGGMPLFRLSHVDPRGWQFTVKHVLDRVLAAVLLLLLSPLLIVAAIAVKVSTNGSLFYRQRRVGRDGREFDLLKFRTMSGDPTRDGEADAEWAAATLGYTNALARKPEDRCTRVGGVLRRYALDELPQLFNVLKGEMSLVGPRPERVSYVRLFEERIYRYSDRHRVKSGLTGWAQVHGLRGKTSLPDRIEWDNYYIENWSLWLDVKILIMTLRSFFQPVE